jgi:hypothetical protein
VTGSTSLIKGWRERNKRSEEVKEMKQHKQASKAADRPVQIKPVNRTHFTPGSTAVAVLATAGKPFNIARVVQVYTRKLKVHWYGSRNLDSTYTLEYAEQKSKGVGPPNESTIWKKSVIDSVTSMAGKTRGKIDKTEAARLIYLARQASSRS